MIYGPYRLLAIPMSSLSDVQSHSSVGRLVFTYSCAAVDRASTDVVRRAVPLRQLSILLA